MPSESLQTRMQAWMQERTPLAAVGAVLHKKTVPLHAHSLWYFLGGMILLAFSVQILTGILLATYYQPSVSDNLATPGAHESVRLIVEKLPHGWWIRSMHHWSAQLMIIAVLVHLFSVLLLKAYRRPRELVWWTGLALLGLTLTAGFTGYLLPWNSLSFAATRVGSGIAAATPAAGPLVRTLLLGGPDVSGVTLTRFFGLHVVVIPLLIMSTIGVHTLLMIFHGSSVPPSVRNEENADRPLPSARFWPDFALRESRLAVLVLGVLMVVAFVIPPPLGLRADPMAPTPEHIKPEWYFFPVFKLLKLLPTSVLGIENLQFGVLAMALVGAILLAMPLLDTGAVETSTSRRRAAIRRRLLLAGSVVLGWAAMTPPLQLLLAHWRSGEQATALAWVPVAAGIIWLAIGYWIERRASRHPGAPATLFGWILTSTVVGYTLWEGLGSEIALLALAITWVALLTIQAFGASLTGVRVRLCRFAAVTLVLGALAGTVVLGGPHHGPQPGPPTTTMAASAEPPDVPADRRAETTGRFAAGLCACVFLMAILQSQIRFRRKIGEMGLPT